MPISSKTIGKAGGFASAFLGAVATEHLSHGGGPVFLVLSHLLTHIGSEFVTPIGEEIIEQLNHKRPNELNHDIQRELIESMKDAVTGLEILYRDKYPDKPLSRTTKKFLRRFKKEIFKEFSPEQGFSIEKNELRKTIYASDSNSEHRYLYLDDEESKISNLLNEKLKEAVVRDNIDENFKNFFLEKFLPLTQFYFGEKLKHDKKGGARRAFERMLAEETLIGINKLIKLQESSNENNRNQNWLVKAGKLSAKKVSQLKSLVDDLAKTNKLEIEFSIAIEKRFDELIAKYEHLHSDVKSIKTHVIVISRTLSTNMRIATVIVIACVAFTTCMYVQRSDSDLVVGLSLIESKELDISSAYPPLGMNHKLVIFHPGGRVETNSVDNNKMTYFSNLNPKWKGEKVAIKLEDKFWELVDDSIILSGKNIALKIRPNNSLRTISGNVFSIKDSKPIANAIVKLEDTTIYTNSEGNYKVVLPYHMLREKHEIKFFAKGFKVYSDIFLPNSSNGQAPLTPLK